MIGWVAFKDEAAPADRMILVWDSKNKKIETVTWESGPKCWSSPPDWAMLGIQTVYPTKHFEETFTHWSSINEPIEPDEPLTVHPPKMFD
jgi:hypothetical protein